MVANPASPEASPTMSSAPRVFRIAAAAVLAAAMLGHVVAARAASATGESSAKASVDLAIVIPVVLRVRTEAQAAQLSIAEADIERGYVDVDAATRLRVSSNNPAGFVVALGFEPAIVSRVEARIAGQLLEARSSGESTPVHAPKLNDAPMDVAYRLHLAPGARPGTYRWPVRLLIGAGG